MFNDLLRAYRRDPDQFSDEQAEKIAREAKRLGMRFPRESKFGSKLAFDAVDSLALGLVPNKWRPEARGEATFGETETDKWASRLGLLGAIPTLGAGFAGKGAIWAGGKALGKAGLGAGASAYGMAGRMGGKVVNNYAPKAQAYYRKLVKDAPNIAKRSGERIEGLRGYARQKAGGVTSLERGTNTSYMGDLWREFTRPIAGTQANLLDQALRTGSTRIVDFT